MKADAARRTSGWLLCVLAAPSVAVAAKTYVEMPTVNWETLVPYVRANIVPELHENEFHVFVCQGQADRSVVTPFDDRLSDFATVFVMQAMREDSKVVEGLESVTTGFRRQVPSLNAEQRARYEEMFWETLSNAPEVLPAIRSLFSSLRNAGALRCWLCDRDPSFAPLAKRIRKGR